MSIRIALMPWWGRAGVFAGFAVLGVIALALPVQGHRILTSPVVIAIAMAAALVLGAVLGVLVGWSSRSNSYRAALSRLTSPTERSSAITAMWRGPVPLDPRIRAATAELARLYLRRYEWRATKGAAVVVGAIGMLLFGGAAVWLLADHELDDALRHGLFAAYFVGLAAWNWFAPRRVERRLAELGGCAPVSGRA